MVKEKTFDDIQKANETIKTTDIKGKDYAEVNQRIKAFRMVYPTGTIKTELLSNECGICIFRAIVFDEENKLLATGTAYEKENSTFINKTSYIENCETSAVGRALGMCGFGIDTSVASAEEVQNAMANQNKKSVPDYGKEPIEEKKEIQLLTENQRAIISKLTEKSQKSLFEKFGVSNIDELSVEQASEIVKLINEKKGNK